MKKFLATAVALIITLASLFVVVGCYHDSNPNEPIVMTLSDKQAVLNGSYGAESGSSKDTYYGVGRTLNVIEDEFVNVSAGYGKIFDTDKLLNLNWHKSYTGKMSAMTSTGKSMEMLYNDFASNVCVSFSVGVNAGVFSTKLKNSFKFAKGESFAQTENEIFYTASQIYAASLIEIDEFYNISQFENLLSDSFLNDIQALENGDKTPEQVVSLYGTHAILAGYYGGRLDCNYYLRNTKKRWTSKQEEEIASNVSAKFGSLIETGVGITNSFAMEMGLQQGEFFDAFSAESIGGANFSALKLDDFMTSYSKWVESLNNQSEYSNIVGFPNRSLTSIWDLLPSKYAKAKKLLKVYFELQSESVSESFLKDYARSFNSNVCLECGTELGDTVNFAGGCGIKSHPYLIANAMHLVNIEKQMDAYYQLTNDVDLSSVENWEPIGGAYLKKQFNGTLDGQGYKIIGLTRKKEIAEIQNKSYFGLFGCIGDNGVVKNIVFNEVNVRIPGPANNNGNMRAFFGVVAGKCSGKVSNVDLNGSYVYACCTNGCSYIGGICGYAVNAEILYCKNNININSDRYATSVGGIVGYAEGGVIGYCENNGNITAICTAVGGRACAGGIGAEGHKTKPTTLIGNSNSGVMKSRPYDNIHFSEVCKTGTTDFALMEDNRF